MVGAVVEQRQCAELQTSFVERWDAAASSVRRLLTKAHHGNDDLNDALQDVQERAWEAYPKMVEREAAALAAGLPSPHHWNAWFHAVARNYLTNQYRRRCNETAAFGERCVRRPFPERNAALAPTGEATISEPEILDLDQLPSEHAGQTTDPDALLLRAAARQVIASAAASLSPTRSSSKPPPSSSAAAPPSLVGRPHPPQ